LAGEVQSESANTGTPAARQRTRERGLKYFMGSKADLGTRVGDDKR
jgi:hypothetical protein